MLNDECGNWPTGRRPGPRGLKLSTSQRPTEKFLGGVVGQSTPAEIQAPIDLRIPVRREASVDIIHKFSARYIGASPCRHWETSGVFFKLFN